MNRLEGRRFARLDVLRNALAAALMLAAATHSQWADAGPPIGWAAEPPDRSDDRLPAEGAYSHIHIEPKDAGTDASTPEASRPFVRFRFADEYPILPNMFDSVEQTVDDN